MFTTPHTKYRATRGSKRSLQTNVVQQRRQRHRRLVAERLEDRRLLATVAPPSGLVSWWAADNTTADLMGMNNASLFNGATYAAGEVGQAFSFDGVDDRAQVADSESLQLTESMSIEGWVLVRSYPSPGGVVLFRGDDRGGLDPYVMDVLENGTARFMVTSLTGSSSVAAPVPLNRFVHLAGTLDHATGNMRLFVDGVLAADTVTSVRPFRDLDPASNPSIGIGNHGGYPTSPHNFPFDGLIDELAVYNRALTANEVLGIYSAGNAGKIKTQQYIAADFPGVMEGSSGSTSTATFTIRRVGDLSGQVIVDWTTADGSGTSGTDYLAASGQILFEDGESATTVQVTVNGDQTPEANETFWLLLSTTTPDYAVGAGQATIRNDDTAISIDDISSYEGVYTPRFLDTLVTASYGGLNDPRGVTIGQEGDLYVASSRPAAVLRFDGASGQFLGVFADASSTGDDSRSGTVLFHEGNLYVTTGLNNSVLRFDGQTGIPLPAPGKSGAEFVTAGEDGLAGAWGMDIGPDGNLYLASQVTNEVLMYNGQNGEFIRIFVTAGDHGLSQPVCMAFGQDGNLYVGSGDTNQVLRFQGPSEDNPGAFIDYFVAAGSGGLAFPPAGGLVFGPDGDLYVSSRDTDSVLRYDGANGSFVEAIAPSGSGGLDGPKGIAFDSNGFLVVSSGATNEILRYGAAPVAVFNVTLEQSVPFDVTVDYSTSDGSALAGTDYVATSGTLVFPAGQTTRSIVVSTWDDFILEAPETFIVNLSNPTGGVIMGNQGVATILDNDQIPLFTDSFELGQWNGLWVEDSQNDWYTSTQRKTDGSYCAEVDGSASDATLTIASPINLLPYGSAELAFDWLIESGLDTGEYLALDLFNGTSWQEVAKVRGNVDAENAWHSPVVTIDGSYLVSNFQFRFRAKMSGSDEDANVDNVRLIATSLAGPPNQLPVAVDDAATTAEDTAAIINVLANDSDPDQDILQVESVTQGSHGAVVNHGNGTLTYTPHPNYFGTDGFSYTISDGRGGTATANVLVTVSSVNDAPVAAGDQYSTLVNTLLNVPAATGVLANDTDVDNDPLTAVLATGPAHGLLVLNGDGSFNYTPDSGYVGSDGFTYLVRDGQAAEDTGTVLINVVESSPATLSINDVSKNEGKNGTTLFAFIVTRGGNTSGSVTVNYATANGSATAGVDYYATSGTLSFAAGETSKTINVGVKGDRVAESDETFFVNLTNAMNGEILRTQGLGTIVNDDGLALMAGFGEQFGGQTVTLGHVQQLMPWAVALWATGSHAAAPAQLTVELDDLPAGQLGAAFGHTITLDLDANGAGWHTGRTTPAAGRVDLLSVLSHEIGHLLGYDHSELADDLMCATLPLGTRRLPGNTPMIGHDLLRSAVASRLLLPEHRLERAFDELADASILASDMPSTTVVGSDLWMLPLTPLDYVAGERQYAEAGQARVFDTITDGVTELLDEELLDLLAASQQ